MIRLIPSMTAFLLCAAPAMAERVSVLVLDASGSMWNRVEGDLTRIEVARDVMGEYFASRDRAAPLSVIAYGHNRRGDCSDIQVVSPMGNAAPSDLEASLRALMPKGMTPLTDALAMARDQIPATAEAADIILVTDGLETCEGDPCALAARLAGEGIDIRAHVVGFGLSRVEVEALSCITDQTGGMLFETNSGAELADALRQVSVAPEPEPEPAPEPAPEPVAEAAFDIGDKAEAGFSYKIRWKGDAKNVDYMGFVPAGESRGAASGSYGVIGGASNNPNNPVGLTAPAEPGMYDLILVTARDGVIARQPIEVVAPNMGFEAIGSVEPGSRVVLNFRGPERVEERIVIARPGDPVGTYAGDWAYALHKNGRTGLRAPDAPGEYEVRYLNRRQSEIMFSRRFGVGIPFEDTDLTTNADLAAQAAAATRGAPSQDAMPEVAATFRLPPGPFDVAIWRVEPLEPGMPPARQLEGDATTITVNLEPGRWKVIAESFAESVLSADVTILPATPVDVTLALESNQLDGALAGDWTLFALPPPFITDPPMAMAQFNFRQTPEGMDYIGTYTTTQAMGGVQSGDLQSVVMDQDGLLEIMMVLGSVGPEPLRIALLPDEQGYAGQMFVPGAIMQMALTRGEVPAANRNSGEDDPIKIVASCDQPAGCPLTLGRLSLTLPNGWSMTEPRFSEADGENRPGDAPMAEFFGPEAGEELRLNPRQWLESNGPCYDSQVGPLCHFRDAPFSIGTPALIIGGTLVVAEDDAQLSPSQPSGGISHASADSAVAGSVTVTPAADWDLVAGSGGYFPITVAAPAALEGTISLHGSDGMAVFQTDLAQILSAQDQVLPIPDTAGMYEIRVVDSTGTLRATTGIQIVSVTTDAGGTIEIMPSGRTQFGTGCFIGATLQGPDGPDHTLIAPVTATANGRDLRSMMDSDAPLAFEMTVTAGIGRSADQFVLLAPCDQITLALGEAQCRYREGNGEVTRDCAQPVSLAPMVIADAGSHLTDAILGGAAAAAAEDDGAITTQPPPQRQTTGNTAPLVTITRMPDDPATDDLEAYRPMTTDEIDAAMSALAEAGK